MGVIVQKYGGSSVANVDKIKNVARRIQKLTQEGQQVVAVVSAMGDTTDELVELGRRVSEHPPPREMDMLVMTGEQVSMALLSMALHELGLSSVSLTGWQAGIQTEPAHGNARILDITPDRVMNELEKDKVVIIAGFQGVTEEGEVATLGRGGSDTTAVAIAGAIKAERCEINTDVEGVFTADPRIVPRAKKLSSISHDEMLELATLGAVVLHPRAVECAKVNNVKLTVQSSFSDNIGTSIQGGRRMEKSIIISGVTSDRDAVKVKLLGLPNQTGVMSSVFHLLADQNINVDMIVQSEHGEETFDISFTIHKDDLHKTSEVINRNQEQLRFTEAVSETDLAKVSIVGSGMITNPGVAAKMFDTLSRNDIQIKMTNTSEIKVSCMIPEKASKKAVQVLHTAFGLDDMEIEG
ncbi:aspartate kinase [Bacillus sp. FJAT-44742]|uniref:aspartate kinase n=1 Tax=Bacillus sp. FJAT-44742 TaxID=2014005 RepID=UPI000C23984E|nr:aspartate kinase [Bacillus sp. FJAT-44742]